MQFLAPGSLLLALLPSLHAVQEDAVPGPVDAPLPAPPGGTLVVVGQGDASITVLDAATGERRATLDAGLRPDEVVAAPDGRSAWVMVYGDQTVGQSIAELSLDGEPAVRATHRLPGLVRPHGCQWVGERLWFTAEANSAIARFNPAMGTVDAVLGHGGSLGHMLAVHPASGRAYVANVLSQDCSVIELHESAQRVVRVDLPSPQPEGLACSPDGKQVWFGHRSDGSLSRLDTGSLEVDATLPVGGIPFRLAFTPDGRLFVSEPTTNSLVEIDTSGPSIVRRIELPGAGTGFTIHPGGEWAAVSLADRNAVALVHLESGRVARVDDVGAHPDGVAWALPPGSPRPAGLGEPGYLGIRSAKPRIRDRKLGGVRVSHVAPGGGASLAGVERNDLILKVNGEGLAGPDALEPVLQGAAAGDILVLDIKRGDARLELAVELVPRPVW